MVYPNIILPLCGNIKTIKVMKTALFILATLFIVSCKEEAQTETTSENFNVEFLFENDGCKMYRFLDRGRYIYYSDCTGRVEYQYSSGGKNKTYNTQETINN